MSFVLATMYLGLLITMLIRGEMAKAANEGFWALKFVYIGGFFFGSLYIPNSFFEWYVDFARIISGYNYELILGCT
jgi:serine incorporator 1/3